MRQRREDSDFRKIQEQNVKRIEFWEFSVSKKKKLKTEERERGRKRIEYGFK